MNIHTNQIAGKCKSRTIFRIAGGQNVLIGTKPINVPKGSTMTIDETGSVFVDGQPIEEFTPEERPLFLKVEVSGNVESITTTDGEVAVHGDVGDIRTENGNVTCDEVYGDVRTENGNVHCGNVSGRVITENGNISRL